MDAGDDRLRLAERFAANRARVLDGYGVALLRHDAARLHEPVAETDVAELCGRPEQQILCKPAEAGEQHGGGRGAFEQIVDRRDAAVGVSGRPAETQEIGRELAVDWKPGAGNRARAERISVGPLVRGFQSRRVALELLHHRQHVMRDRGWLSALRVGVDGKDRFQMPLGQREQSPAEVECRADQRQDEFPLAHAVHRHVDVVPAACRVQPAGSVLAARSLDETVDVEKKIFAASVVGRRPHLTL